MGFFSGSQVDALVRARKAVERGKMSDAEFGALLRASDTAEVSAAIKEYGGFEKWLR